MYGKNWDRIIDIINVVKPECIDKEEIKISLKYGVDWDIWVLDSLYIKKIITLEEYKYYIGRYNERLQSNIEANKTYIKEAEEKGEEYNPYTHYCCSLGRTIDGLKC